MTSLRSACVVLCGLLVGCSGSPPVPAESGPSDGGGDGSTIVRDGPIALSERLVGLSFSRAFVAKGKLLTSVSEAISSSLQAITVAQLDGDKVQVRGVPVKGKLVTGTVEVMTYDPSIDRFVLVVRAMKPHRIEVLTLQLTTSEATFETLTQPKTLNPDGSMFNQLFTRNAGGALVALRGNEVLPLAIGGGAATWGGAQPASTFLLGNEPAVVADPAHGRALAYGKMDFDLVQMKLFFKPVVQQSLLSPPTWSELPMGGTPPPVDPTSPAMVAPWAAYDAKGDRLLVSALHDFTPCPLAPCKVAGLWIADLVSKQWSKSIDFFSAAAGGGGPFATDDDGRRIFSAADGLLGASSLDDKSFLQGITLQQSGDLGPLWAASATVLSDGRVLSTDGMAFRVIDPRAAAPGWQRFGTAVAPDAARWGHSLTCDPSSGAILLVGGARDNGAMSTSAETYVLAADGSKIEKRATSGALTARAGHGAVIVGGALVVAGGVKSGAAYDDVWALDLKSNAWRLVGRLPAPMASVTLRATSSTEVWALGQDVSGKLPGVVSIDVASGKSQLLAAHGGPGPDHLWAMAPLGSGFVGVESGDAVDNSEPQLWSVIRDGDGVRWNHAVIDANDYALNSLRGAGRGDGAAYFVGRHLWEAKIVTQ